MRLLYWIYCPTDGINELTKWINEVNWGNGRIGRYLGVGPPPFLTYRCYNTRRPVCGQVSWLFVESIYIYHHVHLFCIVYVKCAARMSAQVTQRDPPCSTLLYIQVRIYMYWSICRVTWLANCMNTWFLKSWNKMEIKKTRKSTYIKKRNWNLETRN